MPSRPDLRELASNVKEAFADADRETLLEVLTFVIKEYVVEGPPPMMIHQAETLADLKAPTFAQLVGALQTRFDHPELAMFVVDGEQVSVRVGGVVQPLLPGRQPPVAEPPRPPSAVRVAEASVTQRPPPPAAAEPPRPGVQVQEVPTRPAPPPARGLSVRGQPGSGGGGAFGGGGSSERPAPAPAPAAAPPAPPPAAPPPAPTTSAAAPPSTSTISNPRRNPSAPRSTSRPRSATRASPTRSRSPRPT